jgi:TPR repeat protein
MRARSEDAAAPFEGLCHEELLERANEGFDAAPMLELAYRYFRGIGGLRRSPRRALTWLHAAAELGSAEAMYNLALCYLHGVGTRRSLARSSYWSQQCDLRFVDATPRLRPISSLAG